MADEPTMTDGLMARLEQMLTRTPTPGSDDDDARPGKPVPYERFFAVNQRMKAAEEGLSAAKTQVQGIEAGYKAKEAALKAEFGTQIAGMETRHREDLAFTSAGIDSLGRASIRNAWQAIPEANRPKTSHDYWTGIVAAQKAHAEDPEKNTAPELHPTLIRLLPKFEPKQPAGKQSQGRAAPARGVPRTDASASRADARGKGRAAMLQAIRSEKGS